MIKTGLSILKIRIGNFLSLPYHPNSESVKCPIFLTRIVIDKEINVHICFTLLSVRICLVHSYTVGDSIPPSSISIIVTPLG